MIAHPLALGLLIALVVFLVFIGITAIAHYTGGATWLRAALDMLTVLGIIGAILAIGTLLAFAFTWAVGDK